MPRAGDIDESVKGNILTDEVVPFFGSLRATARVMETTHSNLSMRLRHYERTGRKHPDVLFSMMEAVLVHFASDGKFRLYDLRPDVWKADGTVRRRGKRQ